MPSSDPDFLALSGKFRISNENVLKKTSSAGIRRTRTSLVCSQCRKAKLGCDRKRPCGNCVRRDETDRCSYHHSSAAPDGGSITQSTENRLLHLESVIKQLIQEQPPKVLQDSQDSDHPGELVTSTPASPHISNNANHDNDDDNDDDTYVGPTHWSSVLEEIHEIRLAIDTSLASSGPETVSNSNKVGEEVIFGRVGSDTVSAIIAQYLPKKVQIDRYLSIYFSGETYIIPFIHAYHFQTEYQEFWQDTASASPLWTSLLFSICYMASIIGGATDSYRTVSAGPANGDLLLHEAAGKCLVLGHYQNPQPYAVEALAMYGFCKNLRTLDPSREVGTIFSIVVRLAYQMGYHREPRPSAKHSEYEREMRRRCWAIIKQMDLMLSFQLGLPSSIRMEHCNTRSPSNLLDSDFDSTSTVLPESRDENQWSKILWFIVKDRQMVGFNDVWRKVVSFTEMPEEEVLQVDQDLRRMHGTTPKALRPRPIAESIPDPSFLILTRVYIEFIHLKTLCILHRRYMAQGNAFSMQACLEAGKTIVTLFMDLYKEFSAGGQLDGERWMLTNFTVNDFLLGVTVLCLFLHVSKKHNNSVSSGLTSVTDVIELLKKAQKVCVEGIRGSNDARRVAKAIQWTLMSAGNTDTPVSVDNITSHSQSDYSLDTNQHRSESFPQDHSKTPHSYWDGTMSIEDVSWAALDPFNYMDSNIQDMDWTDFGTDMIF